MAHDRGPLIGRRALGFAAIAFVALAGCHEREHKATTIAHLAKGGALAACCTIDADVASRLPADKAKCEREAETTCKFAIGAHAENVQVRCIPHGCDQAFVELDLVGPNGRGHCEMHSFGSYVGSGKCKPQ